MFLPFVFLHLITDAAVIKSKTKPTAATTYQWIAGKANKKTPQTLNHFQLIFFQTFKKLSMYLKLSLHDTQNMPNIVFYFKLWHCYHSKNRNTQKHNVNHSHCVSDVWKKNSKEILVQTCYFTYRHMLFLKVFGYFFYLNQFEHIP